VEVYRSEAARRGTKPAAVVEPEAPENLDDASQREWERITRLLRARGALDALDQAALHEYLVCWRRLRDAEAQIEADGITVTGANGQLVRHPALTPATQYRAALLALCKEFGFTYNSRLRMAMPPTEKPQGKFARMAAESSKQWK